VTLERGPASLFGADGSALVVHEGLDDMRTDPAGNSGPRIACGVIVRAG
jgi:Cu-Zn family superoxide dismutase